MRPKGVPIQSRACVLHMGVAHLQTCNSPPCWTTAELWGAGRGWPRERMGQEHWRLSHGHRLCAPKTVQARHGCRYIYVIYAEFSRSWQTHHRCASPHTGETTSCAPQPRGEMFIGHEVLRTHLIGMAPSLI